MSDEIKKFPFDIGLYGPEPFRHYTVKAAGEVLTENAEHQTQPGPAILQMDIWAPNTEAASEMFEKIAQHLGFSANSNIMTNESVAMSPARDRPSAYNVKFSPEDKS